MLYVYAVANAWKDTDKSTLTNAWHTIWPTMMFDIIESTDENFEEFCVTDEKKMISNLVTYAKSLLVKNVNMLEEADTEEMLNIENDALLCICWVMGKLLKWC